MTTVQTVSDYRQHNAKPLLKTIAWVGLLAGTLDILSACLQAYIARGISAETVLRFIASGAFGKPAFTGGWEMPLTGLLFHYIIAYSFTILFFLLYSYINLMRKNIVLTAVVYGVFIFVVMNLLVLPLTRITRAPIKPDKAAIATGILIVAIGLPLSIFARRFYQHRNLNN
ncbi:hypothetical protein [Niastella sp. OAS944]|uniref:hypothetical protein n=1 Tax=Niastella sp. OAS944 TaxID=2664089 RepID=UPI00349ABD8D|nr:hypothetical protein [Chitinophagaceae bacterium OAS944]